MKLSRVEFKAWLEVQSSMGVENIGIPSCSNLCPLATYLSEKNGGMEVYAQPESIVWYRFFKHVMPKGYSTLTPTWATRFIHAIDASSQSYISPEHALRILERG